MKKTDRQGIFDKFGGRCAYSGTPLEDDWQIDHIHPVIRCHFSGKMLYPELDNEDNLIPCQKLINHYKGSLDLETFRNWFLGNLHLRLNKPKNPRTEKSKKTKEYRQKIADYFGITADQPFSGKFYFETIKEE